jgi:hypothetical protein
MNVLQRPDHPVGYGSCSCTMNNFRSFRSCCRITCNRGLCRWGHQNETDRCLRTQLLLIESANSCSIKHLNKYLHADDPNQHVKTLLPVCFLVWILGFDYALSTCSFAKSPELTSLGVILWSSVFASRRSDSGPLPALHTLQMFFQDDTQQWWNPDCWCLTLRAW